MEYEANISEANAEENSKEVQIKKHDTNIPTLQYGGSPIKIGDDEYSLFRDAEYVPQPQAHTSENI